MTAFHGLRIFRTQQLQMSYAHAALNKTESTRVTPLCLRVIVNEKPIHLEKTTSSVLSVLFANQ